MLATQHLVDEHVKQGLIKTVKDKKNRRKQGKKLNILREEDYRP